MKLRGKPAAPSAATAEGMSDLKRPADSGVLERAAPAIGASRTFFDPAASEGNSSGLRAPVLMLGSGRCGSTLLQRILNSSPDVTIWGEHGGALKGIANSYFTLTESEFVTENLRKSRGMHRRLIGGFRDFSMTINWVNPFDRPYVQRCFRRLLTDLFTRNLKRLRIHWGFKEILYNRQDRVVEMWRELFPETRYIFTVRSPYCVIKSMMIAWHQKKLIGFDRSEMEEVAMACAHRWVNANEGILLWRPSLGEKSVVVRYEDLLREKEAWVDRLFEFLNVPRPAAAMQPFSIRIEQTGNSKLGPAVDRCLSESKSAIDPVVRKTAEALGYSL